MLHFTINSDTSIPTFLYIERFRSFIYWWHRRFKHLYPMWLPVHEVFRNSCVVAIVCVILLRPDDSVAQYAAFRGSRHHNVETAWREVWRRGHAVYIHSNAAAVADGHTIHRFTQYDTVIRLHTRFCTTTRRNNIRNRSEKKLDSCEQRYAHVVFWQIAMVISATQHAPRCRI